METLQQQARALGDPTRHRIFRYVVDAGRPVGVAELTDFLRLNHNAIRQHLAKLVDADLLLESTVPTGGQGRPRLVYEPNPAADSRWGAVGPYERLSLLLTEVIRSGDSPEEVGRRAGSRFRRDTEPDGAVEALETAMTHLGFEPEVRRRGRSVDCVLGNCPFAAAALADRDTVCALHLGLARGITELADVEVDELVIKDPRKAGCRIRMRVGAASPG
jgi:predicted ArsR family transcriptional regulator